MPSRDCKAAVRRKKSEVKFSSCKCAEEVDKLLASKNGQLVGSLRLNGAPRRIFVAVEKLDGDSREKPPLLAASFCPFCGKASP